MKNLNHIKLAIDIALAIIPPIVKEIKKDGFQLKDLISFINDDEFKKHIEEIIIGIGEKSIQHQEIDLKEYLEYEIKKIILE
jgi:hypothetical protein